jgi:uncharacterized Ntn-hydrolase superfamily protein
MIRPSTFSIVVYDPKEQAWGIAVASKFLAVGAVVPWARAGAGAVATQSYANTSYGPRGLEMMTTGKSAEETLQVLLVDDPQASQRQVGLVDAVGKPATFTGEDCYEWAGGLTGEHYAVQGNILTGPAVIEAMAKAFSNAPGGIVRRLYEALRAGDLAGGDRRGRQSAAILVVKPEGGYAGFNDRWVDLRVDDHPDPVRRLGEILNLQELYFGRSPESERTHLSGDVLSGLQQLLISLGYYEGEVNGVFDPETKKALRAFIGNENFEDRVDFEAGLIDNPVLSYLMEHFK